MRYLLVTILLLVSTQSMSQLLYQRGCVKQPDGSCVPQYLPQTPYQQQQTQPAQPQAAYIFCYSDPAPGTKTAFVSNVFQTNEPPQAAANFFESYTSSQRLTVRFTCESGSFASMLQRMEQTRVNQSSRGYTVKEVRR